MEVGTNVLPSSPSREEASLCRRGRVVASRSQARVAAGLVLNPAAASSMFSSFLGKFTLNDGCLSLGIVDLRASRTRSVTALPSPRADLNRPATAGRVGAEGVVQ
eukprot:5056627-Pyramimonas_sp.AAC.1